MKKEDAIGFCRYYKGEDVCPPRTDHSFWNYERVWVELKTTADSENSESAVLLSSYINDYLYVGLREFEKYDETPMSLKALLFNRYCYWSSGSMADCVKPFKEFYKNDYTKKKAAG